MTKKRNEYIQQLEFLLDKGYVDVCGGRSTQEEIPQEIQRYLTKQPRHLILEVHRRPIGKIDGVTQYSGCYMTVYIDRKSWRNQK